MDRQFRKLCCWMALLWCCEPLARADQPTPYVEAPGIAYYSAGQAGGFDFEPTQTTFGFTRILLQDAPVERSELGAFFHFIANAGEVLVGSILTRHVLREDLALVVNGSIEFTPRFDQMARVNIRPCADALCADVELRDGDRKQGKLWFQPDSRREFLLQNENGVLRRVALESSSRVTLEFRAD
jgi:hypothetical protein